MSLQEGIEVPPLSRAAIRTAAARARQVLKLPEGAIDVERLLERLFDYGVVVDIFDADSAPVPRSVEACYVPEHATLYIRDTVYAEMCRGGVRAMFTLGHEVGHIVLAHRRTMNRQRSRHEFPIYCNSEWQADAFSAEFTMPVEVINNRGLHTPEAIAKFFGVSMPAAQNRIKNLQKYGELKRKP
jgi:hypothetical protein